MNKEATEIIAKLEELKSKLQSRIGYYGIEILPNEVLHTFDLGDYSKIEKRYYYIPCVTFIEKWSKTKVELYLRERAHQFYSDFLGNAKDRAIEAFNKRKFGVLFPLHYEFSVFNDKIKEEIYNLTQSTLKEKSNNFVDLFNEFKNAEQFSVELNLYAKHEVDFVITIKGFNDLSLGIRKQNPQLDYYCIRETYLYKIENAIQHLENGGVK